MLPSARLCAHAKARTANLFSDNVKHLSKRCHDALLHNGDLVANIALSGCASRPVPCDSSNSEAYRRVYTSRDPVCLLSEGSEADEEEGVDAEEHRCELQHLAT
jgi:hypothetical protein